jgi:PAS domain S-box-containing protein
MLAMLGKSIDIASDAVFWLDENARFVCVNDSACKSVGYSSRELLGLTLFDINPESSQDGWFALLKGIRTSGTVRLESVHRRKDGTKFPVDIVSTHVTFGGREFINGFARDITDRKKAESMLRERVEELVALQSTVLDITASHELPSLLQKIVERTVHLINAEGGALYLCDPREQTVRCVVSFNTPRDYVGTTLKYGEGAAGTAAETGQPLLIDDYRTWAGRAAVFESTKPFGSVIAVPMFWQGNVTGVIDAVRFLDSRPFSAEDLRLLTLFANHAAIARENTRLHEGLKRELAERERLEKARLELEQRMLAAQKLEGIGLLAGGVAHDFNNMLAVILGYAELLQLGLPPESEAAAQAAEIIAAAERSRNLTRQLLAFGRRQSLELMPLDLNDVIRGLDNILRRTVRESIAIAMSSLQARGSVMADVGQIEQVILNLVANAQDAMPAGGTIAIETNDAGGGRGPIEKPRRPETGRVRPSQRVGYRAGDVAGNTGAHLRSVFHHEGQRHRARPFDGLRDREAAWRKHRGAERAGERHLLQDTPSQDRHSSSEGACRVVRRE